MWLIIDPLSHSLMFFPQELRSCGWTKKDKRDRTPNVVNFTHRFNHVSVARLQEHYRTYILLISDDRHMYGTNPLIIDACIGVCIEES